MILEKNISQVSRNFSKIVPILLHSCSFWPVSDLFGNFFHLTPFIMTPPAYYTPTPYNFGPESSYGYESGDIKRCEVCMDKPEKFSGGLFAYLHLDPLKAFRWILLILFFLRMRFVNDNPSKEPASSSAIRFPCMFRMLRFGRCRNQLFFTVVILFPPRFKLNNLFKPENTNPSRLVR